MKPQVETTQTIAQVLEQEQDTLLRPNRQVSFQSTPCHKDLESVSFSEDILGLLAALGRNKRLSPRNESAVIGSCKLWSRCGVPRNISRGEQY